MLRGILVRVVLGVLGLGLMVSPAMSGGGKDPATVERVNRDLVEVLALIEDKYAGTVSHRRVIDGAIETMLHTLDPHSAYYNREAFEEFRTEQQSQYFGIGTLLGFRNGKSYIVAPGKGTPAFLAGLRYGDEIIEVDDTPIEKIPYGEVSKKVRGPRGTRVVMKVRRLGEAEPLVFQITRDAVPQPSIPYTFFLAPGVGYISIAEGFNTTTGDEMDAALEKLKAQGLNALILDLRGNRGGLTSEATRVASHFLDYGQAIYSQRGRVQGMSLDVAARSRRSEKVPLIVLIDGGSASASEIVAGAVQDHDRGLVLGERSFGKGLIQSIIAEDPSLSGGALILTTGKYFTPSGRLIQRQYEGKSYYDYYASRRGVTAPTPEGGAKHTTDSGRVVYGGGGIAPDIEVKPRVLTAAEGQLLGPIFGFAREVMAGQVKGLEGYKVDGVDHDHNLTDQDYPVTDQVMTAFRAYARAHAEYKLSDEKINQHLAFIKNRLRAEFVTAAYGTKAAYRVTVMEDTQVQKAIQHLPQARQLAERPRSGDRARQTNKTVN